MNTITSDRATALIKHVNMIALTFPHTVEMTIRTEPDPSIIEVVHFFGARKETRADLKLRFNAAGNLHVVKIMPNLNAMLSAEVTLYHNSSPTIHVPSDTIENGSDIDALICGLGYARRHIESQYRDWNVALDWNSVQEPWENLLIGKKHSIKIQRTVNEIRQHISALTDTRVLLSGKKWRVAGSLCLQ
jgi:hypothetical protein